MLDVLIFLAIVALSFKLIYWVVTGVLVLCGTILKYKGNYIKIKDKKSVKEQIKEWKEMAKDE